MFSDNIDLINKMESVVDVDLTKGGNKKNVKTRHGSTHRKPFNRSFVIVLAILVLFVGVGVFVGVSPRAKHVSGVWNKTLSAFAIPNNPHAQESYNNYLRAVEIGLSDKSESYLYEAFYSNPSQLELINGIAKAFGTYIDNDEVMADHYQKALILSRKALRVDPNNLEASKRLGAALFATGRIEESYDVVQNVLFKFPNDPDAIDLMCRIAVENKQWDTLEKWGENGYKNVSRDNRWAADILYMYSKGLYENSKKKNAAEVFAEAELLNIESWARDEFIEAGGLPCEITSLLVANSRYDRTEIDKPGSTLYSYRTQYLSPFITVTPYRSGSFTFDVKLYSNGKLSTGNNSKPGYSFDRTVVLDKNETSQSIRLGGWGADEKGHWSSGSYRFEIWWRGSKLYVKSFDIN